mmetsp:Transcript_75603/g.138226  ORF Transcript_75603/g.138226 Transcript_75603/m.138226 type:complete len:475 (+) Transcript_75603:91-1515(+)
MAYSAGHPVLASGRLNASPAMMRAVSPQPQYATQQVLLPHQAAYGGVFLGGSFGAAPGISESGVTSTPTRRAAASGYSGPSNMPLGSHSLPQAVGSVGSQPLVRQMNPTGSASSLVAPTMTPVTPGVPQASGSVSGTVSYQPPTVVPGDGYASAGVAAAPRSQRAPQQAGYAAAEQAGNAQDEALVRTRLRLTGNEELLQSEIESLRRSLAIQEDRIVQLTKELQAAHESERKLCAEAEAARSESARLTEEVRLERLGREQAEAAVTETRLQAEAALQEKKSFETHSPERTLSSRNGNASSRNGSLVSGRRPPTDRSRGTYLGRTGSETPTGAKPDDRGGAAAGPGQLTPKDPLGAPAAMDSRPQSASNASGVAPPPSSRRGSKLNQPAKDEIDIRLREFLERSETSLTFRRLNRGWYAFRRPDEKGPLSNDRTVELSITNGKLMAKLEPTTHDAGWNNGKLGPIERFVAHMSM